MTDPRKTGPVLIELEPDTPPAAPDIAPPVTDPIDGPQGAAMQQVAALAVRRPSRLARWFWGLLVSIVLFFLSLAAWNAVTALITSAPILGYAATALVVAFCLVCLVIALREWAAYRRLSRLDTVRSAAEAAISSGDLGQARKAVDRIEALYAGRDDVSWGRSALADQRGDVLDADGLIGLADRQLLAPLDQQAAREVEAAARQVAMVTALVPLALADVFTALTANLRMIRRIAEIYGGRSGTLGGWRLTRSVFTHLIATGAVAVGDDLVGSVAGGGVLSKVSRRFGEGIVNGALTARVGVAAMEVCRPLPFAEVPRPSVTALVRRALTGLFGSAGRA
jgi:putative membrane protein